MTTKEYKSQRLNKTHEPQINIKYPKTILDTLRESNTNMFKFPSKEMERLHKENNKKLQKYGLYLSPVSLEPERLPSTKVDDYKIHSMNPIHYTKEEMEKTSKWKKYVKKIHDLIQSEYPDICLVKKTNNAYRYESNTQNRIIRFECRFEGVPNKQRCTCIIYEKDDKVFHMTKKTPKRLYKELDKFIDFRCPLKCYKDVNPARTFVSSSAKSFTSFQ